VVVLGANAKNRLGVVNGTTAIITDLDLRGRAMTVRTLEEEPPRTIRLPGWYLDAAIQPGQSRRVDLAYARTDMRSQGRTEQRALLALDGAEDMQGGYVQLTRSKHRTDLYLTVGPEPRGPDEERAPSGPGGAGAGGTAPMDQAQGVGSHRLVRSLVRRWWDAPARRGR
jgi:hypothetical protein